MMRQYEILLDIRLADIEIHIIADTDNQSTYIWQNCHFENTILVLVMSSRSVKLTVQLISQLLPIPILQKCGQ